VYGRGMQNLYLQLPETNDLAICEQVIKLGANPRDVRGIEQAGKDLLHCANSRADPHAGACTGFQNRGGRQVVGMSVGLKHPGDDPVARLRGRHDGVDGGGGDPAGGGIKIEHGVDDRRLSGAWIPDQIRHRECRLIEK